jgi:hypothetical protein
MPPAGLCRVWFEGVPPGQQPRPINCRDAERIASRNRSARVLYGQDRYYRGDRNRLDDYYDGRYASRDESWDAAGHYRQDNRRYQPRRLGRNDRIYRGSDNRFYCRRDDGTSGLITGGIIGGLLGNIIAPRGSRTIGTIVGGTAGAVIGRAADEGDIVCR